MDTPSGPALEARGIYHIYQVNQVKTVALRGADLVLEPGTWTTIMGPSGSGKSTLLHILAGLMEPSAGVVTAANADISHAPPAQRAGWRRKRVGLVLQRDNLHPHLNVADNIALPLRLQNLPANQIRNRTTALLEWVGLPGCRHHLVAQLSGGEAQRAAIAVALAHSPTVLLADEPTGELDDLTTELILDLLEELLARERMAILTMTHNPLVTERASRHLVMRDGVLIDAA